MKTQVKDDSDSNHKEQEESFHEDSNDLELEELDDAHDINKSKVETSCSQEAINLKVKTKLLKDEGKTASVGVSSIFIIHLFFCKHLISLTLGLDLLLVTDSQSSERIHL
jgi:hypothetical protein